MKIGGVEHNSKIESFVTLPRPDGNHVRLRVKAYPLGFDEDEKFPLPQPPKIKARRANGVVERINGAVVWDVNDRDPAYLAALDETTRARNMYLFANAVCEGDGPHDVRFNTDLGKGDRDSYLALWDEVKAAGFSFGDINLVVLRARAISNQLADAIEASKADFSPDENSQPASRRQEAAEENTPGVSVT